MTDRNSREELALLNSNKRLAYTLAAGAAVAVCQNAHAEVVYSGPQDISIDQGMSQGIQFDTDPFNDVTLKNFFFPAGYYQGLTIDFSPGKVVGFQVGNIDYVTALAPGFVLDFVSTGPDFKGSMAYGMTNPNAQFNNISDGYIGLSFPIGGATQDVLHFAWMRVDIDNAAGTFVIRDWAWESEAGVPIAVGDTGGQDVTPGDFDLDGDVDGQDFLLWQRGGSPTGASPADLQDWQDNYGAGTLANVTAVPEPVTLGLLACGSTGLALLRRARER